MTRDRRPEDRIAAWLDAEAPTQAPDRLMASAFETTRTTRQDRPVSRWRILPMTSKTIGLAAAAIVAVAIVAIGTGMLAMPGGVGAPAPSAEPSPASPSGPPDASASAASDAPASDAPATATGQMAFHAMVDGNTDIYLLDGAGTSPVRLTTDPDQDVQPSWSPDGRRIVFARAGDVWTMADDGTGQTQLTSSPERDVHPRFSPDGTTIVFGRARGVGTEAQIPIWTIAADGSGERLLYDDPSVHLGGDAVLESDSSLLVLEDPSGGGNLRVVHVDLTTGIKTPLIDHPGDDASFALSSDGSRIAFQSDVTPGGVWTSSRDGSDAVHVSGTSDVGVPLAWTADDAAISYGDADGWIYLVRPDGTGLTPLVEGSGPAWRPGG